MLFMKWTNYVLDAVILVLGLMLLAAPAMRTHELRNVLGYALLASGTLFMIRRRARGYRLNSSFSQLHAHVKADVAANGSMTSPLEIVAFIVGVTASTVAAFS
jgi:uncharacterized membrane protein HdeD (DUF308 family)